MRGQPVTEDLSMQIQVRKLSEEAAVPRLTRGQETDVMTGPL